MYKYIKGMSMEKQAALRQMASFASIISEHIIKLVLYSEVRPNSVDGWIHTVANWIHRADNITLKPKAKKPTADQYMMSLFNFIGDDVCDFERELYSFKADNLSGKFNYESSESYPDVDITYETIADFMYVCNKLSESAIKLLADKATHELDEYDQLVRTILQ